MKLPFMDFVVGGVLVVCVSALGMLCCYCLKKERNSARLFNARLEAIVARMDGQPVPPVDVDQPLWYVRARGLEQSLIDGIKIVKYKKDVVGLVEGNECAICLSEFEENDSLRVLPKCGHAFHVPCVDQWFMSHSNCPLCRNPITHAMIVAGVPLVTVTPEAVLYWARRNRLERANRAALGGLPLDGVAIGDQGTSQELSGSESSESENGRNGLVENKDSPFSGSSKVTVESDHPWSPIDKDFQLPLRRSISADPAIASKMNGYVAELRIQVNSDASLDSNSAPSGSTSKETSPALDNKMARSASFGGSPSSGKFGSSQNPTLPY